jgi:hypothetical protein
MHAYWRSTHGSGSSSISSSSQQQHQSRSEYTFLDQLVDNYGATIVENMFTKPTGYNPTLTSETIKVITSWMGFIQSIYDAVTLCALDENANGDVMTTLTTNINDPSYISPVDIAAAFWYGNFRTSEPNQDPKNDGSLYAWTILAKSNFGPIMDFGNGLFDTNDAITSSLSKIQKLLPTCLVSRNSGQEEEQVTEYAKQMRNVADDIVRYATVPMIQQLVHHCATLAMGVNMTTTPTSATTAADDGGVPVERHRRVQELDDVVDWIIVSFCVPPPLPLVFSTSHIITMVYILSTYTVHTLFSPTIFLFS